jgi:chemotaxis protein CheD
VEIMVSVSDAKTSRNPQDTLLTHALGSCIGVMLYDDLSKIAGMLHFQLPSAASNPDRAAENPTMFADTGMTMVLGQMQQLGANTRRLRVRLAGGAEMLNDAKIFNIGRRNYAAIRKILWQTGLLVECEDVGGRQPRTVRMDVANGAVTIKSNGEVRSL